MDTSKRQPPVGQRLSALLSKQHGVVSRGQLRALRLSDAAIHGRVARNALVRVDRGVYAAGHDRLTQEGRWMAAVLASGPGAVLSHRSAGALWGVWRPGPLIEVTVPRDNRRRSRGNLRVHRSTQLQFEDVTKKSGIPVTKPARTLLDLAEVVVGRPLERALDESTRLRLCTESQLHAVIARQLGRIGGARLKAVLDAHDLGSTATENDFEELFLAICDRYKTRARNVRCRYWATARTSSGTPSASWSRPTDARATRPAAPSRAIASETPSSTTPAGQFAGSPGCS